MNKELNIIFMCGGRGRRMGYSAKETQKCMLPFKDRPILHHSLEQVTKALGRFNPILAVGYRSRDVIDYFGRKWNKDDITYVHDSGKVEDKGVLLGVKDYLSGGPFLIVHGNIIFEGEILEISVEMQEDLKPIATLSLAEKVNESNHAVVRLEDNRIVEMIFPPPQDIPSRYLREMGIYVYDMSIYDLLRKYPQEETMYMMAICTKLIPKEGDLAAVLYLGEWIHFETPEDLKREDWKL